MAPPPPSTLLFLFPLLLLLLPPLTHTALNARGAEFGYKGAPRDGGAASTSSSDGTLGVGPQQRQHPARGPFNPAENARLALEAKSAVVEKLQARLAAAEEAIREGEERELELEHRLAQHEGDSVMKDADTLDKEMAGAFASLRSGFGTFLGEAGGAGRGKNSSGTTDTDDIEGRKVSAMKSSEESIVNKQSARGGCGGGGRSSGSPRKPRVGFVDDKEQARLDQEAEFVAQLTQVSRANDELMTQLAACEEQLRVKRHQMKVAKSSYKALSEKFEAETRRREKVEEELEEARGGGSARAEGGGSGRSKKLSSDLERSRELLRHMLTVMRGATRTSRASTAAVVAAFPAIAALLAPGDIASELLASGVAGLVAEAMTVHPRDAKVAARGCALLASLARGGLAVATPVETSRSSCGGGGTGIGVFLHGQTVTHGGGGRGGGGSLDAKTRETLARGAEEIAGVRGGGGAAGDSCCVAIAGALKLHGGNAAVCHAAADAVWAVSHYGGAAAAKKLIAAGCAAGVAQAMRWHPSDEDVAATSACAALSLASGDDRNADEVAAAGAAREAAAARALGLNVGLEHYPELEEWLDDAEAAVAARHSRGGGRGRRGGGRRGGGGGGRDGDYDRGTPKTRGVIIPEHEQYVEYVVSPTLKPWARGGAADAVGGGARGDVSLHGGARGGLAHESYDDVASEYASAVGDSEEEKDVDDFFDEDDEKDIDDFSDEDDEADRFNL